MIKYKQEYTGSGSGLGCQISAYAMMTALAKDSGLEWVIGKEDFHLLRSTFDLDLTIGDGGEYKPLEIEDEVGYNKIKEMLTDNSELYVYPTPYNLNCEHTDSIASSLTFKEHIQEKCHEFRDKFKGEVIAMHVRRGDFFDLSSGMFVCGADYYRKALDELPPDLPVLIFSNDKDNVILDHELIANNPERFTFITDLYNDNELIDCDDGQELDRLIDNDGRYSKFNYKHGLIKLAQNQLKKASDMMEITGSTSFTVSELKRQVVQISKQLHPTYKSKIKGLHYSAAYDLCLMTMCDYMIMANSSYGLWASVLGNPKKVIYPMYWMQGHPEDGHALIKTDLNGFNQTKQLAGCFIKNNYIPVENPDPRSFEVVN